MLLPVSFASFFIILASANTVPTNSSQCSYFSSAGIQPDCWRILEMDAYINQWWADNEANCTAWDKGFSQCYLDQAGYISWTCDIISVSGCTPPPSGRNAGYSSYQEFYMFWNIYAINQFWSNYHQALLNGQAEAIGTVSEIVKVVSPPRTTNAKTPVFAPLWGVSVGLLGAFGPFFGTYIGALFVYLSILGVLGGGGGLAFILFPKKDVLDVAWEDLAAALSQTVDDYQKAVGNALTYIQRDYPTFRNLTSNGAFSQKTVATLPESTSFMYHGLTKWVFNQAIQAKGYFSVKNPSVNPMKIPMDAFDCIKLDEHGTCGPIWFDGVDSYGLARARDVGMDRMEEICNTAFSKNWTTPYELYIDAQKCQGKNGSEAFTVEDLSISCASNTPQCIFNFDYNPFEALYTSTNVPEFLNCPDQRGWGVPEARFDSEDAGIPRTYLGPFLGAAHIFNEKADTIVM